VRRRISHAGAVPCDLELTFDVVVDQLPVNENDDEFLFTVGTVPQPPEHLTTDRLVVKKGITDVGGSYRLDFLQLAAEPTTLRQLGVLVLGVLLHPDPSTCDVDLIHPASDVKKLRIRFEHPSMDGYFEYWAKPIAVQYWASDPFSLLGHVHDTYRRPWFRLTSQDEIGGGEEERWWRERDTVVGFGTDEATVAIARFFLDAAIFDWPRGEYQLEGPIGNEVLHPQTANVRVVLPNSELWPLMWDPPG